MTSFDKLIVVDGEVLPEIFIKVLETKKMIAQGESKSVACKNTGISRSAYYKYKDSVFSYDEKLKNKVINLYALLKDEPGILSAILTSFYEIGANVLTINQNFPIDSVASVTFSIRLNDISSSTSLIKKKIRKIDGVLDIKIISGE